MNREFNLKAFNSYGGFSKDGNEYHILNTNTPLPWCNVLANERFGSIISNKGTIYTYFKNSREYKLTYWCNDWTDVTPGETFKGLFDDYYNVIYGFGYVKVTDSTDDIYKTLDIFVPENDDVKIQYINLDNKSGEDRIIDIEYKLNMVLGVAKDLSGANVLSKLEDEKMLFKNPYIKYFNTYISYLKAFDYDSKFKISYNEENTSVRIKGILRKNEQANLGILFGAVEDESVITNVLEKYSNLDNVILEYENTKKYWLKKVKVNDIKTGDEYLDILMGGWLLYQTIACRMFSKSAFYQSGGAIGYRDQLQDSMSVISSWPERTRNQIILHSSKQFEKGDVLHWWHDHANVGIRTYFSDDYLWLAYVLCEYITKTSDYSILDVETNYLQDRNMGSHRELYDTFYDSDKKDSVYNHAKKTILYGLSRKSEDNGLLDIGDGDWNDGFSNIRGQSVWLTFFMIDILNKFIKISEYMKDESMITTCKREIHILKNAIVSNAYEDKHFVRAFFENGEVLGSFQNEECKIDLIAQAWAAIALKDYTDMEEEITSALKMADKYLVDRENKIVKLLYPPFDKPKNNPGYIKAYVPGIRENGGQYTHGAIWLAKAYFEIGKREEGLEVLKLLCPIYHSDNKEIADIYKVEPFVMAADVYSNPEHLGRGGWTWYTGSSAWMYKVMEDEFGKK